MPTSFTMLSPTSPGPLSDALTPVGGIVIDLFGVSGGRIEAELGPSELYSGTVDAGSPVVLGSKSGFSPTVLDTLGGGLSSIAVRVTMNDGGTGPGDPWRNADALLINGASLGSFGSVVTQQTSADGQSGLSMNPDGGFRSGSLDTGFFSSTDPGLLSQLYASIAGTGQVGFAWQSTAAAGRSLDFMGGLSPEIQAASGLPILAFNPPIITGVKVDSPIDEGSTATIEVTAFNLHRPSSGDVLTYQFDPNNDGTFPISNTTGAATIAFDRPGTYVVPIRVYNLQGARADAQAVVEVRNVAPTLQSPGDQQAVEGSSATIHLGSFADPGRDDPWTVVVDWGDGSAPQTFDVSQAGDLGTTGHLYARAGSYSVGVKVADAGGLSDDATFLVNVTNVAPAVASPGDQTAVQGAAAVFPLGSFTDPGQDDPWLVAVDWGDGSPSQTFRVDQAGDLGSLSHSYARAATFDVSVTVVDLDGLGLGGSATFRVVVQGVAPSLASPGDQQAVEGNPESIALGNLLDALPNGPWTIRVDWGDGSADDSFVTTQAGTLNPLAHTFPKAGKFPVAVLATASNGLADSASFFVDVANLAPSVASPGDQSADEGTAASFALGSFTDPGADSPWTIRVSWSDGGDEQTTTVDRPGDLGSITRVFGVHGVYRATVEATDSLGLRGTSTFIVTVGDVAPAFDAVRFPAALVEGETGILAATFHDPGFLDRFHVAIDWGDGTTTDLGDGLTARDYQESHSFATVGAYQIAVTVVDLAGASATARLSVAVGMAPSVVPPPTPSTPTPAPAAQKQGPPISQPIANGQITPINFFSSPSPNGQTASPAPPPKGSIPAFLSVPGQGLAGLRPFAKLALGSDAGAGGRSLEEILAVLLTPPKAVVQLTTAARGSATSAGGDPRGLVPTGGLKSEQLAFAGLAEPEAVTAPVSAANVRPRSKAARVMILVVAWTVSLRNQRGSRYSKRWGRYSNGKASPSARPA